MGRGGGIQWGQGNFSGFLADGGGAGRYYVMRSKMPALAYLKKQIFVHEQKRLPFSRPGSGVKGQLLYLRGTRLGLRKKHFIIIPDLSKEYQSYYHGFHKNRKGYHCSTATELVLRFSFILCM